MDTGELGGEGTILDTFRLSSIPGIFWVTLAEGFSGRVAIGCILEGPVGRAPIKRLEFALKSLKGKHRELVVLGVDAEAAHLFAKGQTVKIHRVH